MKILLTDEVESGFGLDFFDKITAVILEKLEADFSEGCEVSLLITSDEEIKILNEEHRGKDSPTDVLSFPMDDEEMLGDIVISIDTAKKDAEEYEISLQKEIAFLYIHGFLHLLGYDHETGAEDEKEMFELQNEILNKCGF